LENRVFAATNALSRSAISNFQLKQHYELAYVGDAMGGAGWVIELALCILFVVLLVRAARSLRRV
jgi:hypothetical protein